MGSLCSSLLVLTWCSEQAGALLYMAVLGTVGKTPTGSLSSMLTPLGSSSLPFAWLHLFFMTDSAYPNSHIHSPGLSSLSVDG